VGGFHNIAGLHSSIAPTRADYLQSEFPFAGCVAYLTISGEMHSIGYCSQLLPSNKLQRSADTVLNARRFQTFVNTTNTKGAFPGEFSLLVKVNGAVGTTMHANAAAGAFILVYDDNAILSFSYGTRGAEMGARWFITLEAHAGNEVHVYFTLDYPWSYSANQAMPG
jgi:hypothetical protein